ncbi:MAG: dienelactone hydrolase family protein [Nakamurella sp.]
MADSLETQFSSDGPDVLTSRSVGVHSVPLTVSTPAGPEPTAGIVVIQDAFGVSPSMVEATERFARQGYLAVAPHLYHRVAVDPVTEFEEARPLMTNLNGDDVAHDIADAREYLDSAGVVPRRMGIVGFCMGGTISLWQAASGDFAAAVTFYGGGVSKSRWKGVPPGLDSGARLRCPWLGMYGDKDRSITTEDVEQLRDTALGTALPTSIVRYPTVGHAFATDPTSPNFDAEAAADAWAHAVGWFDAHLR